MKRRPLPCQFDFLFNHQLECSGRGHPKHWVILADPQRRHSVLQSWAVAGLLVGRALLEAQMGPCLQLEEIGPIPVIPRPVDYEYEEEAIPDAHTDF